MSVPLYLTYGTINFDLMTLTMSFYLGLKKSHFPWESFLTVTEWNHRRIRCLVNNYTMLSRRIQFSGYICNILLLCSLKYVNIRLTIFTFFSFQDVDDCPNSNCMNGASCIDGINTFTCACPAGFTGPTCNLSMVQVLFYKLFHFNQCNFKNEQIMSLLASLRLPLWNFSCMKFRLWYRVVCRCFHL